MSKRRRKFNLPLVEIIAISLIAHIAGLVLLGSFTIWQAMKPEEPELEAPVIADLPPPPPQTIPVQLTKKASSPPSVIAMDMKDMPLDKLEFDMPEINQRVGVGMGSGIGGPGNGGNFVDLQLNNLNFMNLKDNAESVCFIVDYSLSMKDKVPGGGTRFDLLKEQLTASLKSMDQQMMVSVIFFSGPAWIAGESEKKERAKYDTQPKNWHYFKPKDFNALTKPEWHRMDKGYRAQIIDIVNKEKMTGGTVWANPLQLAKTLQPAPEVIYFLTDGATSDEDIEETLALVRDWKRENRDLRIHTIALGEPKAADGMRRIASLTKGKFRLIESIEDIDKPEEGGNG